MKVIYFFLLITCYVACSPNNVTIDNSLQHFFDDNKVQGTFGIYNNGSDQFTIYNLSRFKDSAYLPASTFKVVNSLIGLETGKISNEKMVIKWDGITRPVAAWNRDLSMDSAFKVSAVPYFQEVARRIGKDTMQFWLDSLGYAQRYGKFKVGTIDTFWLDNTVKITADEQLGLVKRLYFYYPHTSFLKWQLVKVQSFNQSKLLISSYLHRIVKPESINGTYFEFAIALGIAQAI